MAAINEFPEPSEIKLPVIMCLWQRIERLEQTLELLSRQTNRYFDLYLWNNNPEISDSVNKITSRRYPFRIFVHHHHENVGGVGRFLYAQWLVARFRVGFVVFVDDDLMFDADFVETLAKESRKKTVISFYAFKFPRWSSAYYDYWPVKSGEDAHYCGTGGMIVDADVFTQKAFFDDLPEEYRFVEDLWLSYYCIQVLKWRCIKSSVSGKLFVDGKDICVKLCREGKKSAFLHYLKTQGWLTAKDYSMQDNVRSVRLLMRRRFPAVVGCFKKGLKR